MGKCLVKQQSSEEKKSLENYIKGLTLIRSARRSTIMAFQQINKIAELQPITRSTIENNIIKKSELLDLVIEACEINSEKIHSDYYRYYDTRKTLAMNNFYKEILIAQVSLLNKNLRKFPHVFANKYQITESVYQRSILQYFESEDLKKTLRKGMMQAFRVRECWGDRMGKDMVFKCLDEILLFWEEKSKKISVVNDIIAVKGMEGDLFLESLKFNEIDIIFSLEDLGFYRSDIDEFDEFKAKYADLMQKACQNLSLPEPLTEFGALGLVFLKQFQV